MDIRKIIKEEVAKVLAETEREEVYNFKGKQYVIQNPHPEGLSAYKIIANEDVEVIDLTPEEVKHVIGGFRIVDKEHLKVADINKPVILATIDGMWVLIDGNHRVTKAASEGIGIKAYLLNDKQTKAIETDSADPMGDMIIRGRKYQYN
jgi:hypothetical protein